MSDPTDFSDAKYTDPATGVLRNKLGISDPQQLDREERTLVSQRMRQGVPTGTPTMDHLQAIHKHLFQDVYEWAGQIRTVDIGKGTSQFQPPRFIRPGLIDIDKRLQQRDFLKGLSTKQFCSEAGKILGDINYAHPFREGNGRTQLQFLKQLGKQAGHDVNPKRFDQEAWMAASIASVRVDYEPMIAEIERVATYGLGTDRDGRIADTQVREGGKVGRADTDIGR